MMKDWEPAKLSSEMQTVLKKKNIYQYLIVLDITSTVSSQESLVSNAKK